VYAEGVTRFGISKIAYVFFLLLWGGLLGLKRDDHLEEQ